MIPAISHQVDCVAVARPQPESGNEMPHDTHAHVDHAASHGARDLPGENTEVRSPLALDNAFS